MLMSVGGVCMWTATITVPDESFYTVAIGQGPGAGSSAEPAPADGTKRSGPTALPRSRAKVGGWHTLTEWAENAGFLADVVPSVFQHVGGTDAECTRSRRWVAAHVGRCSLLVAITTPSASLRARSSSSSISWTPSLLLRVFNRVTPKPDILL